jgi:acetylornithine deacetylase/succinyl-diaminopimelate desuccinylase-like protein
MPDLVSSIAGFMDLEASRQRDFLAQLVRVPSDNPPGDCAAAAARAEASLSALGFTVEAHPVQQSEARSNGMVSATNLIARQRFGIGGPTIALNAHGDVVPPGRGWTRDPYGAEVMNDPAHGPVMYGRGVAVSKSDFATYAWAMLALRELNTNGVGENLNGTVELHCTYDEEVGGAIGPARILKQGLSKPDYAICAGFSYSVTTAHNGCLHLEVVVNGKAGHAAMPSTGIDSLQAATQLLQALYKFRDTLATRRSSVAGISTPTLNVGLINGGINTNVVPDRVTLRLDRRIIPEESPPDVEQELRALNRVRARAARHSHRRQTHHARRAARRIAEGEAVDRGPPHEWRARVWRAHRHNWRAALYRRASLRDCGNPNSVVRRRPAHATGSKRPRPRRVPTPRRFA